MIKRSLLIITVLAAPHFATAQHFNVQDIPGMFGKGKLYKVNGGLSASTVFYNGSESFGRQPFSWYVNGNLNLNLLGQVNLPFSFNLTNAGAGYAYPTLPNRLSLHPSYKNVTGHIGDVAMSFSPYTLNGHQFTGVGVDVAPEGWYLSAMYGRLQRAVEYDSTRPQQQPSYRRMGAGIKMGLQREKYEAGFSVFKAADEGASLHKSLDSLNIYPRQNIVISVNGVLRPMKGLELQAEYANSAMTVDPRDVSSSKASRGNLFRDLWHQSNSTVFYKAFRTGMNYTFMKSTIGVGYERIDPGYQTLGAYYFNNDLENITVNFSQAFLRDKASVSANVGYQRDDLDNAKSGATRRMVGSFNISYMPMERLQTNLSYSNFQTFMHIKPQFEYINQVDPLQNMDTLNFQQLSQNASLNVNYIMKSGQQQSHNLNLNLSVQDAADLQNGILRKGNGSQFYNANAAYTLLFVPVQRSITSAFNLSYNTIGRSNFLTLGPTLGMNARLFDKKVTAGFSSSYNASINGPETQAQVLNFRMNAGYLFMKKHNLSMNAVHQTKWVPEKRTNSNVTATVGYNYSF